MLTGDPEDARSNHDEMRYRQCPVNVPLKPIPKCVSLEDLLLIRVDQVQEALRYQTPLR